MLNTCESNCYLSPTLPGVRVNNLQINPLNADLNPICHLLALLGAHHILHVSRIRVKDGILFIDKHRLLQQKS